MMRLENKVVLVTGAKGGLGSFVTEALLAAGATVVGVSRSIKQSDFAHAAFHAHAAELGSLEAAAKAVAAVVAGQGRLDAVVHLVGGFDMGPNVEETGDDAFARMFELNFYSALHLFRASALLELGLNSMDGTGATLAWPLVRSAAALLTEVADGEEAGPSRPAPMPEAPAPNGG